MLNCNPSLRPNPTTGDHDFHNFESTPSVNASTNVFAFMAD